MPHPFTMITTQYITASTRKLRTMKGPCRYPHRPHMTWDTSTTPPTLLTHRNAWTAVRAGAVLHQFFLFEEDLWTMPSTTEECSATKVFSRNNQQPIT